MAKPDLGAIPAARTKVLAELDALPEFSIRNKSWEAYEASVKRMVVRLVRHLPAGAVITGDWRVATVRICGVRSTSTIGIPAALRNWHAAAGKALESRVPA